MVAHGPQHEWQFNVDLLNQWIEKHGTGARERLAGACDLSAGAIEKIRSNGHMPNGGNLFALAEAMGVPVERLGVRVPKKKSA